MLECRGFSGTPPEIGCEDMFEKLLCDAFSVEMWVMLHGIELVWYDKISNPVVDSDFKVMINKVNQENGDIHNFSTLVRRIKMIV